MKKLIKQIASAIAAICFLLIATASVGEEECGCTIPSVTIPSYADSFDDKEENWEYKECAIAESDAMAEKIHVYVYYNSVIDKYRCELRYSWPGEECRMSSKTAGSKAISTADISKGVYDNGRWKTYDYWLGRQF